MRETREDLTTTEILEIIFQNRGNDLGHSKNVKLCDNPQLNVLIAHYGQQKDIGSEIAKLLWRNEKY